MYGVARGTAGSLMGKEPNLLVYVSDSWCDVYSWEGRHQSPGLFVVNSSIMSTDKGFRDHYGRRFILTRECLERLQCRVIPKV